MKGFNRDQGFWPKYTTVSVGAFSHVTSPPCPGIFAGGGVMMPLAGCGSLWVCVGVSVFWGGWPSGSKRFQAVC